MNDDIFKQANRVINSNLIEKLFYNEKAYFKNGEYWTLNPLRPDKSIGSFSISENGFFNDFSTGESGDFISLVSQSFNLTKKDAAEKILHDAGYYNFNEVRKDIKFKNDKIKNCRPLNKTEFEKLKSEFEDKANDEYWTRQKDKETGKIKFFEPVNTFPYRDSKGNLLFYVVRYEEVNKAGEKISNGDKQFTQFYFDAEHNTVRSGIPTNIIRPFFNQQLLKDKSKIVLIVEGEKSSSIKIDGYVVITWCGGAKAIHKANWDLLKDRDVILWPDNDTAGIEAMKKIKENYLPYSKILDVELLNKANKYDIADAEKEGLNIPELIKSITPPDYIKSLLDNFTNVVEYKIDIFSICNRFKIMNEKILSIHRPGVKVIGGESNTGKTSLETATAISLLKNNPDMCYILYSLDDPVFMAAKRILSQLGNTNYFLNTDNIEIVKKEYENILNRIYIFDTFNINFIEDIANYIKRKTKCKNIRIAIDYLQIVPNTDGKPTREHINTLTAELKTIQKTLNNTDEKCILSIISQLNRDRNSGTFRYRESSELENMADVGIEIEGAFTTNEHGKVIPDFTNNYRKIKVVKNKLGIKAEFETEITESFNFTELKKIGGSENENQNESYEI